PRYVARVDDHVAFEIQNALEVAHGDVQQVTDARRKTLEEPHMGAGRRQFDVAQALTADFAERYLYAALVANHTAVLHALVFSAEALPVGDRTENLGAKQAVTLGLKGSIVNGFRLGDFSVGPGPDFFRTGQTDANGIEISD